MTPKPIVVDPWTAKLVGILLAVCLIVAVCIASSGGADSQACKEWRAKWKDRPATAADLIMAENERPASCD